MQPDVEEFTKFHRCLMKSAPKDYKPWYIKLEPQGKHPIRGRSWSAPGSRMAFRYAVKWLMRGGNIGIAGRSFDPLVNIDLDGDEVKKNVLKPSLTTRSRSRTGIHGFYFTENKDEIPNIPTDNQGEVRCQDQYVVCAGSYVPVDDPNIIPEKWRDRAGYYTVEDAQPPAWITYQDIPDFFRKQYEENKKKEQQKTRNTGPIKNKENCSALFSVTAEDVLLREVGSKKPSERWGSIFHDSHTEANMSISNKGLLQCWRHGVSHNGLQALTVLSGYMTCLEAGTPHKGGTSKIVGDNGAIFHAWLYAKTKGYIPIDDPIPSRALNYIAKKHLGFSVREDELLPREIYKASIDIVEEKY